MRLTLTIVLAVLVCSCATAHHGPGAKAGGATELICHKGNKTLELPVEAVDAHLGHGDSPGPCLVR